MIVFYIDGLRPDVVREIYRLLAESKAKALPSPDGIDFHPFGIENNRKALELVEQPPGVMVADVVVVVGMHLRRVEPSG